MQQPAIEFSAPFNWCDSRCDRCPLLEDCAVGRRLRGSRWVHEMRGEDPDDPAIVMADVKADLQRTVEMLESIIEKEGISLDDMVEPPTSLLAVRLRKVAKTYAGAVDALTRAAPDGAAAKARAGAILVSVKLGRLTAFEPFENLSEDEAWHADAVPNLLLIERSAAQVAAAIDSIEAPREDDRKRYDQASAEVGRLIAPWMAMIPAGARAAMDSLIARGRAPSPFCTTEGNPSALEGSAVDLDPRALHREDF